MLPSTSPSSSAYSGAVIGAQFFLNTVAIATTNPPSAPTTASGITASGVRECRNMFHVHADVASASSSRIPVLFTVPLTVIASCPIATPSFRKAVSLNVGLEVRINCATDPPKLELIGFGADCQLWGNY